ncbi:DUF6790 family protein [Methanobacterium alcaliphilum]|uniref:DUF6790 family protein n=1 Tax=Methanobacterium alcaliphilum TaxID=392018 RepID=UPI00200B87E5|nr:DUF6790 family protein [Methanobacterium alcaliphilum]MCK9151278.1 hypothetical protein [Methanobacterium alcaliphilum]
MLYIWPTITALLVILLLVKNKKSLNTNKIIEIFLLSFLVVMVGIGSIWTFLGHTFMAAQIAAYIGWPAGSPFQFEVACANLSFGVLGILSWKFRDNFWTATIIGYTVFFWGAAYGHIMDMINFQNYAPGNVGAPLYMDIIMPIILIILLVAYKLSENKAETIE